MTHAFHPAPSAAPAHRTAHPGVHLCGDGVDVVVDAREADAVDFALLRAEGEERSGLVRGPYGRWHAHVPGVRAGDAYGLRVHGAWEPAKGRFHNPAKLLLDPYARGVTGALELRPEIFGHEVPDGELHGPVGAADPRDSAPYVPHAVVLDIPALTDRPSKPGVPWNTTVLYEAHVRGLTLLREDLPAHVRGTYAGLAHPLVIEYLRETGITTLELLPIHAIATETSIAARGLPNYWGYSTLGYFAPEPSYATKAAQDAGPEAVVAEVRAMVDALHAAGIEVVLDVVYNHTCEGGTDGPLLSLRGLDNTGYYLHADAAPAQYLDVTGTGNSLDFRRQRVVQLALDSMRHWVRDIGVDGFRFDLAVTMGRRAEAFDAAHPLLVAMASDEVLREAKLIAEPWDLGPSGWRTGQFLPPMHEWNDGFRDAIRRFWLADARALSHGDLGAPHDLRELATRLAGSADLFDTHGRGPESAINLVTAHDGFTLADLVRYDHKHNEANLEDNRDGNDHNLSWNHGIEGPLGHDSPAHDVEILRRRSMRNILGTLLAAAGTPMLTAGDEFARTQHGNNNAYCQDSEISWASWQHDASQRDLLRTTRHLIALRRDHPALRPDAFARGHAAPGDDLLDLAWFSAQGAEMDAEAWHDPYRRVLQARRSGGASRSTDERPRDLLLVINGSLEEQTVDLAPHRGAGWELVWDSVWESPEDGDLHALGSHQGGAGVLEALSLRYYLSH